MSVLIRHAYDCSIRRYMDFAFLDKRDALTMEGEPTEAEIEEAWYQINIEYSDYSSEHLDSLAYKQAYIYRVKQHIVNMANALKLQFAYFEMTGEPFTEGFEFFKNNGHKLEWNNDIEAFKKQLTRVETKEKTWRITIIIAEKEYQDMLKDGGGETQSKQKQFAGFVKMLNILKAKGYPMDKDKDSIMDLAVVILMLNKQEKANID